MERIDVQLLLSKLRTKEDRFNFMGESGNHTFNILGFYLPNERGFDSKFVVQVLKGQKNVTYL